MHCKKIMLPLHCKHYSWFFMDKKNIALLCGGDSREAAISLQSAANVYKWISPIRYNVFVIEAKSGKWQCLRGGQPIAEVDKNDFSITLEGQKIRFDLAFIMIHGSPGENGLIQGYLEMLGIPHTTCSAFVSALTFNKFACKAFLREAAGIFTPKAILAHQSNTLNTGRVIKSVGLPFFVKPNCDGSSFGVSKVKTPAEAEDAFHKAFEQADEAIVEEFIEGTEVSVGVMHLHNETAALPVTEIVSQNEFFDYQAKYDKGMSQEITPARLPRRVYQAVQDAAVQTFAALRCRGIVRIDYIVRGDVPYFLEINTIPGMSGSSIIPQQIEASGGTMQAAITALIETSLRSHK